MELSLYAPNPDFPGFGHKKHKAFLFWPVISRIRQIDTPFLLPMLEAESLSFLPLLGSLCRRPSLPDEVWSQRALILAVENCVLEVKKK